MQTLADFWPLAGFLVERPEGFDEKAWAKVMGDGAPERLQTARDGARGGRAVRHRAASRRRCGRWWSELGVKPKEVFQPVRVAISGTTVSPGIFESVAVLGREETLARIDRRFGARRGTQLL